MICPVRSRTGTEATPLAALSRAKATALATRSDSETASTSPLASASSAETGAPETIIFSAFAGPTRRGRRTVPPAPGSRPSFTSGSPSFAPLSAMRKWQPSASSSPPPSAVPWMAATVGFSIALQRRDDVAQFRPLRRLAEFGDVGPGDEGAAGAGEHDGRDRGVRRQAFPALSAAARGRESPVAFTGGLSMVTMAISPSRVMVTVSVMTRSC